MKGLRARLRRLLDVDRSRVVAATLEVNSVVELKKAFGWELDPILDDPAISCFEYLEDLNERRRRDAESVGTVARNIAPQVCLDIGTGRGHSAALMAVNAPAARVVTVNASPEEIVAGRAGKHTTIALPREEVGSYYRQRGLANVEQVFANTADWEPQGLSAVDLAFIDGCHDADYVVRDTRLALAHLRSGGFILWHDFHPGLVQQYPWIRSVCEGVERLLGAGLLRGRILHLRDSWTGVYRAP
ncbi:MAG TPA: class I SAM-dependent methyltransferase [Thermoanaerobaculia bacterium]|nr:class I SAM-dependent methyltransferase [Thermoanaerobaculia bacterium]